ncbi:DUF2272 domain-containing protein [Dyadobacter pollutisoli]|uniref:DUF2272 domain-containing protein n=1 Tax=Dyadobacter pollutisoli TaxID=2910158 RepID=A0A9E8NDF3_9BACT|nr:DUF2272 domain-containing protein [Dyadobacter pollutisoli]WAC12446.1 DUF2272 domain-containing protein [Dyadobacter pollutisoli]
MDLRVNTPEANLRIEPNTSKAPLAILPVGHLVTMNGPLAGASGDWQPCSTFIDGHQLNGFVHASLLRTPINAEVDRLIETAGKEYKDFLFGKRNENHPESKSRIDAYWASVPLAPKPVSVAWSAVFISFVVREALLTKSFKFSQRHTTYFSDSKTAFLNNDASRAYWAVRLNNRILEVGDLVGYFRTGLACGNAAHSYDDLPGDFCSHSDVVVAIRNNIAFTIGGNVSQTVKVKEVPLTATGKIAVGNQRILVMQRNF